MKRNLYYIRFGLYVLVILICVGCAESVEERLLRLEQEGSKYYSSRQYREALATWKQALTIRPDDVGFLKKIGDTYMRLADISMLKRKIGDRYFMLDHVLNHMYGVDQIHKSVGG